MRSCDPDPDRDQSPFMTHNEKLEYYDMSQVDLDEEERELEEEYVEKHWKDIQIREALERRDYS